MPHHPHPQGEAEPQAIFRARAETLVHQLFPTAPDDATAVGLPLFRLINLLTEVMADVAGAGALRQSHPRIRVHAACIAHQAFPLTMHDDARLEMPLSRLIQLLEQAMAEATTTAPSACLQADALNQGVRYLIETLHEVRLLAEDSAADQPDGSAARQLKTHLSAAAVELEAAAAQACVLWKAHLSSQA